MGAGMTVFLQSFGHKYGAPEADMMLDARCLENPFWVPALREKTGLDAEVQAYVFAAASAQEYAGLIERLLLLESKMAQQRGGDELHIAVGCTGGRHRSVALAERLGEALRKAGAAVVTQHRDISRG